MKRLIRITQMIILFLGLGLMSSPSVFAQDAIGKFYGDWSTATKYPAGSVVEYAGSSFIATIKSQGVTPSATSDNWAVFAAQGPVGAPGAPGAQGPTGPQGAQGSPGPAGLTGAPGAMGAPGPMGPSGAAGAVGPLGPIGPIGPAGSAGPQGGAGPQGPAGTTGAAGASGVGTRCPNGNATPIATGRYIDCGDGTLVDSTTGLMWEEKMTCGSSDAADYTNPRCDLNTYTWSGASADTSNIADGTLFTDFLAKLNQDLVSVSGTATPCFAKHCDWRIPKLQELLSIENCLTSQPCIDPAFGPTQMQAYWSSSTVAEALDGAWGEASFNSIGIEGLAKSVGFYARAVRGGQ